MQIIFSLNKFTAVYSRYRHLFHNKKSTTIFIKWSEVGREGGKHIQEWALKRTLRTGIQEKRQIPPSQIAQPFPPRNERQREWEVTPSPVHFFVYILIYQMAFWESRIIAITYKLLIELKAVSLSEEEEYQE